MIYVSTAQAITVLACTVTFILGFWIGSFLGRRRR